MFSRTLILMFCRPQKLVACGDLVGQALVPYYRQLLPVLNIYINK